MNNNFDYEGAKKAGYSDEEIQEHLSKKNTPKKKDEPSFGSKLKNTLYKIADPLGGLQGVEKKLTRFFSAEEEPEKEEEEKIHPKYLKKFPKFDVEGAKKAGYSIDEIEEHLESQIPEKSLGEKLGRTAAQFGLGALQANPAAIAYDVAAASLSSHEAQTAAYRETLSEDLERLMTQKQSGQWDEKDQGLYDHIVKQIQNTNESDKFIRTMDVSTQGIIKHVTGVDLAPEGVIEHGARWLGFLKDPKKGIELIKQTGIKPTEILKQLIPGTKTLSAGLAGTALEMAEENQFGFTGTMAVAIAGDMLGHTPQGLKRLAQNPKQTIAQITNVLTRGNSTKEWTNQILNDAKEAGIQLDAGTITNSNIIKWMQARANQSALSGNALENFRKDLSGQFLKGYENIVNEIGSLAYENNYQAAEAIKNYLKTEEQAFPAFKDFKRPSRPLEGRVSVNEQPLYQQEFLNEISPHEMPTDYIGGETLKTVAEDIKSPIKQTIDRRWTILQDNTNMIRGTHGELASQLERFVANNSGSLLLGESTAEFRVLNAAQNLINRLRTEANVLIDVSLSELIQTKRTLGDVANWEIGTSDFSSRFKELTGYIDNSVQNTLERLSPDLLEAYQTLNAEYSEFKNVFENKNVEQLFEPKNQNYNSIYNSYVSNQDNLRSLEDMFYYSPRGVDVTNQVKRDFAQRVTSRRDLTPRDIRNLGQILGPDFEEQLHNFDRQRNYANEHPLPSAAERQSIGIEVESPQTKSNANLQGRVKESDLTARKKLFNKISEQSSDQILKQMDTVEGIKKLKSILGNSENGRELFRDLSRFKLEEMIGRKMFSEVNNQIKLGKFSGLITSKTDQAIVKELIGIPSYNRLKLLQTNAGVIEESSAKFYNASKSGTTIADVGIVTTGITGLITGNPYLFLTSLGSAIGMRIAANLLSDPVFLKYLEKAVLTNRKGDFLKYMNQMRPQIEEAAKDAAKPALLIGKDNQIPHE